MALAAFATMAQTLAATLHTDHSSYLVGETIKAAFTNGPANAKDWIGIYPAGVNPSSTTSTKYLYVDGTSGGAAGVANGEVSFTGGLATAGTYTAYLMENDGYRILAQDNFTIVETTAPLVRTVKQVYRKGESISVAFNRAPGNAKDWIGIYAEGVEPGAGSAAFLYLDGTTTGEAAVTDGSITIPNGLVIPGRWVAYLLENDTYTPLASDSFEVVLSATGLATIVPDHEKYLPGQPVKIAFSGGHGNPTDWVGVYRPQDRPGPVGSTVWNYVNNTHGATTGITEGEVSFDNGLSGPQVWRAYFLLNDGYEIVGETTFEVLADGAPIVQTSKRTYDVNEPISVHFQNAPGNAKDWIGIYPKGEIPDGNPSSTVYKYTDGTTTGTPGIAEGTIEFASLNQGEWTAFLLENDGYTVLASESFTIKATGILGVRVVSASPNDGGTAPAAPDFKAVLENRGLTVNTGSIALKLDGQTVAPTVSTDAALVTITAQSAQVYASGSAHTYILTYQDSTGATFNVTNNFTIGPVVTITLPAPLYFENFDSTPEGSLPAGWTPTNFSDSPDIAADLHHLGSLAYANFTVVEAQRFAGNFLAYNDLPDAAETVRPLSQLLGMPAVSYVKNGSYVRQFAVNKILFGLSGYHGGTRQILEVTSPEYNLSGKSDIHLSFTSLLEQNQDSIEGIEVTSDGGTTWSPVVYYLDGPDIVRVEGVVDVEATFNTANDAPLFEDGSGGTFGAFLKAPIDAAAGAATVARANDDAADGTRIENIRVAAADNKTSVKFRIFYAGTDSWYFGLDNWGLYSVTATVDQNLTVARTGQDIVLTWTDLPGSVLESTTSLQSPITWGTVSGVTGNTYTTTATEPARFFRVRRP